MGHIIVILFATGMMNNFELNVVLSLFDQAHFVIISKAVNNPLRSSLISAH